MQSPARRAHREETAGTTQHGTDHASHQMAFQGGPGQVWSPDSHTHTRSVAAWRSGNGVGRINEVTLRARLVLGWVNVSGFNSRRRHFISVCN